MSDVIVFRQINAPYLQDLENSERGRGVLNIKLTNIINEDTSEGYIDDVNEISCNIALNNQGCMDFH